MISHYQNPRWHRYYVDRNKCDSFNKPFHVFWEIILYSAQVFISHSFSVVCTSCGINIAMKNYLSENVSENVRGMRSPTPTVWLQNILKLIFSTTVVIDDSWFIYFSQSFQSLRHQLNSKICSARNDSSNNLECAVAQASYSQFWIGAI